MPTVMRSYGTMLAVQQSPLPSSAMDIVKMDWDGVIGWSISCSGHCNGSCKEKHRDQKLVDGYIPISPELGSPSWKHTTVASGVFQKSSHTVPHSLLEQISTRPSMGVRPPVSLKSPSVQPI